MSEEGLSNTNHKKIFVGKPTFTNIDALMKSLKELYEIVEKDNNKELISKLEEIVPTYKKKKDEVAVTIYE